MKICVTCLVTKESIEFGRRSDSCYECQKKIAAQKKRLYYQKNKEHIKSRSRFNHHKNADTINAKKRANRDYIRKVEQAYRDTHPEYQKKRAEKSRKYYYTHRSEVLIKSKIYRERVKERYAEYERKRIKDPHRKLATSLRIRLYQALKKGYKSGSAVRDLGCSVEDFRKYLESKFQPGMTWDNYGKKGWQIDHIIPLASFNLEDREQLLKACHYTNLQPLWWYDNYSKGSKLPTEAPQLSLDSNNLELIS